MQAPRPAFRGHAWTTGPSHLDTEDWLHQWGPGSYQPGTSAAGKGSPLHHGERSPQVVTSRFRRRKNTDSQGKPGCRRNLWFGLGALLSMLPNHLGRIRSPPAPASSLTLSRRVSRSSQWAHCSRTPSRVSMYQEPLVVSLQETNPAGGERLSLGGAAPPPHARSKPTPDPD